MTWGRSDKTAEGARSRKGRPRLNDSSETTDGAGKALAVALRVHRGALRTGTDVPYMAHILRVAALVAEAGGDDQALAAALLHDTIEDGGAPDALRREIKARCGSEVLDIVECLSDAAPYKDQPKNPWHERKTAYIDRVRESKDWRVHLVCLADKTDNLNSTLDDLATLGDSTWGKFSAPKDDQRWYYETLADVFRSGPLGGSALQEGYARDVDRLRAVLGG